MILVAILGLLVPGYLLARAIRSPMAWAIAFPLSSFLIAEIVIAYSILGIPLRFAYVLAALVAISLGFLAAWMYGRRNAAKQTNAEAVDSKIVNIPSLSAEKTTPLQSASSKNKPYKNAPHKVESQKAIPRKKASQYSKARGANVRPEEPLATKPRDHSNLLFFLVMLQVGLVLFGISMRTYLYPLSGNDTTFRWDGLARLMLGYENLSYYPPISGEDYAKYTYPDGFPPLVSTLYWWLYAAWGEPCPAITAIVVVLQIISCYAIVFLGVRAIGGQTAGLVALIVLSTSSRFLWGAAIGQETGFTALACAGQIVLALAAVQQPKIGTIIAAGLFGSLGALTREYGPILALSGFAILAAQRKTWRYLPLFCLIVAVCGSPWFIRNWFLTGNPVYPVDPGLGWPGNPVHLAMMAKYHDFFALSQRSLADWASCFGWQFIGAPLAIIVGVAAIFFGGKQAWAVSISALLGIFLWLWSVPFTAGGLDYSSRVLTSTWIALAIAAGAFSGRLLNHFAKWRRFIVPAFFTACVLCSINAVAFAWAHPFKITMFDKAVFCSVNDPLNGMAPEMGIAMGLDSSKLPPMKVLTDDCYLAVALQRYTDFSPVMVWSPEAACVFDRSLSPADVRQRLLADNIGLVTINDTSINFSILNQYPFYSQDRSQWKPFMMMFENVQVYQLPRVESPKANATPQAAKKAQ
jgi:hypothetical protein